MKSRFQPLTDIYLRSNFGAQKWQEFEPMWPPFKYSFLDNDIDKLYRSEQRPKRSELCSKTTSKSR